MCSAFCNRPAPCEGVPLSVLVHCLGSHATLSKSSGSEYRLGDVVLNAKHREREAEQTLHNHPASIASQYLRRTNRSEDISVLQRIVDRRIKWNHTNCSAPSLDTLVVHLRLGDVLDVSLPGDASDWQKARASKYERIYTRSPEHYVAASHKLLLLSAPASSGGPYYHPTHADRSPKLPPIRRIVLVASTAHCPGCRANVSLLGSRSFAHLTAVHNALARALSTPGMLPHSGGSTGAHVVATNRALARSARQTEPQRVPQLAPTPVPAAPRVELSVRLNRDADEDLVYMSLAPRFVCSGGGFSHLLARMVVRHEATLCVCEPPPEAATPARAQRTRACMNVTRWEERMAAEGQFG